MFPFAGTIDNVIIKTNRDVSSGIYHLIDDNADGINVPTTHAYEFWNGESPPPFTQNNGTIQSLEPWNFKVWANYPAFDITTIQFTLSETMNELTLNRVVENPFRLQNFRKALNFAFNYLQSNDAIFNNFSIQGRGPIPKGMFGYNENLFQYSYNLEQAVTYWNTAMNNDALDDILANNSYRIILYYNSGNELRRKIQLLLKDGILDMLDTEGCIQPSQQLSIEVQGIGWSTYLQSAVNGRIGCCVFDLEPDYADPDNCVYPYVHTEGTYGSWAKIGEALGWNGDQVDGWIEEAGDSQNEDERISIYDDIQEAVVEFAAYVWVCQKTIFHVEHAELNGYQYNPMYDSYFYHYCKGSICSTTTTTPYDSEDMMIVVIIAATVGGIVGSIITLVVVIFIKRRT